MDRQDGWTHFSARCKNLNYIHLCSSISHGSPAGLWTEAYLTLSQTPGHLKGHSEARAMRGRGQNKRVGREIVQGGEWWARRVEGRWDGRTLVQLCRVLSFEVIEALLCMEERWENEFFHKCTHPRGSFQIAVCSGQGTTVFKYSSLPRGTGIKWEATYKAVKWNHIKC